MRLPPSSRACRTRASSPTSQSRSTSACSWTRCARPWHTRRRAEMPGVTVVLAADHPVFRDGLVGLLERGGIDVLAAVEDGRAAVDAIRTHRPQVAIVDL